MRAMFPLGVNASWARLVTAFSGAVAISWAATTALRGPWSVVAAVALVGTLLAVALLRWRGGDLSRLLWAGVARRRVTRPGPAAQVDHRLSGGGGAVAIRARGHELIAVVAVDGPSHSPSVLDHHRVRSAATLPIAVVAAALDQFDVALSGIDVLSAGRRRAPAAHHPHSDVYTAVVGDHPAVGRRRTWCVLRLNSVDNAAAVAGRESVAATLAACAARLAAELTARHCPARVVDAAELADIDRALLLGVDPGAPTRAGWGGLVTATATVASYAVSPADISTATLDRLWSPDTDGTATTVQLRRGPGGTALIGVLVRYLTAGPQLRAPLTGLNPLAGRHDLGLAAGLADPEPPALAPRRRLAAGEDLRAPIGATGVILGATAAGHPLLVPLESAAPGRPARVTVAGELALLAQIAQRAAAAGLRVAVVTSRPAPWLDLAAPGLRVLSEAPENLPDGGKGVMVLLDGPGPATVGPAAVEVRAVPRGAASVADIHLEQDTPTTAVIRTADFNYRLSVDVRAERNQVNAALSRRAA